MTKAADKIIVALDVATTKEALQLVEQLQPDVSFFKVGLQLYTAEGPEIVRAVLDAGAKVFLDLKFNDIPTTVARTVEAAGNLGVQMLTIHLSGGTDMIRAAVSVPKKELWILGVTVLTSADEGMLRETGISDRIDDQVLRLAKLGVAKGVDGIVFVADSQDHAIDANLESLQNLEDNLKRQGVRIREIPLVLQFNKRDLPNALPVAEMVAEVNKLGVPYFESVATTGLGVEETLKGITHLVLSHLIKKYGLEGSEPMDKEIQILNPSAPAEPRQPDSLWDEDDDFGAAAQPARSTALEPSA